MFAACGEGIKTLLDVGCGNGAFLRFAIERNPNLRLTLGIENRVQTLASDQREQSIPPLLVGDGQRLPFSDRCFDAVLSIDALEWTLDPVTFLKESARVCEPGGRVVAVHTDWDTVVYSASDEYLSRRVLRAFCDSGPAGWMGRRLPALFRAAGFADVGWNISAIANDRFVPSLYGHHLAGVIADWAAKHGCLPANDIRRWRSDLAELDSRSEYLFSVNRYICHGSPRV